MKLFTVLNRETQSMTNFSHIHSVSPFIHSWQLFLRIHKTDIYGIWTRVSWNYSTSSFFTDTSSLYFKTRSEHCAFQQKRHECFHLNNKDIFLRKLICLFSASGRLTSKPSGNQIDQPYDASMGMRELVAELQRTSILLYENALTLFYFNDRVRLFSNHHGKYSDSAENETEVSYPSSDSQFAFSNENSSKY